jgi:hypothetical protein
MSAAQRIHADLPAGHTARRDAVFTADSPRADRGFTVHSPCAHGKTMVSAWCFTVFPRRGGAGFDG